MNAQNIRKGGATVLAFIMPAIFTFIGILFLCIGIGLFISDKNDSQACTEKVTAVVTDIRSQESSQRDSDGYVSYTTTYSPVFQFTYNGKQYTVNSNLYSNPCNYSVGQRTEIYCNPDNPTKIYEPDRGVKKTMGLIFGGVGAVFAIVGIVVAVTFIKLTPKVKKAVSAYQQGNYGGEQYYPQEENDYWNGDEQ